MTTKQITISLEYEIYDYISTKAKEEERSFNKMINRILRDSIKGDK